MPLRAGVPQAVIAEISSRCGIVGTIGLRAIAGRIFVGDRPRRNRHRAAIIIILVVVIALRIIARSAVVAVALRGDRAADYGTGYCSRDEAATATTVITAAIIAAIDAATAAAKARTGRATAAEPRTRRAAAHLWRTAHALAAHLR